MARRKTKSSTPKAAAPKTQQHRALSPFAPEDRNPCYLFRLPNELLLPILETVVTISSKDDPIKIDRCVKSKKSAVATGVGDEISVDVPESSTLSDHSVTEVRYRKGAARLVQPPITRTCAFLRHEGLKPFYAQNTFYFHENSHSFRAVARWKSSIGPSHFNRIENMYMQHRSQWSPFQTYSYLHDKNADKFSESEVELKMLFSKGQVRVYWAVGDFACRVSPMGIGEKREEEVWVGPRPLVGRVWGVAGKRGIVGTGVDGEIGGG